MDELNWLLMLGAGIIASASPGPATFGIAGTSMRHGRRAGLSLSAGTSAGELALVVIIIGLNNAAVFFTYAFLFSNGTMARAYARARRWFEGVFAALFGLAGVQILTMRLTQ